MIKKLPYCSFTYCCYNGNGINMHKITTERITMRAAKSYLDIKR